MFCVQNLKNIKFIAFRDIFSFFVTPRAFVLLAAFLTLWGFYFFNILGRYIFLVRRAAGMQLDSQIVVPNFQQFVIESYFQMVLASFVFLIPLLAMRSFVEERQSGTFEILKTSAVSSFNILIAKFLAQSFFVFCFSFVAIIFPLSLLYFGELEIYYIWSGFLGIFLCGVSFSALALAFSARTEKQLVGVFSSGLFLGLLLLIHTGAAILPVDIRKPLQLLSSFLETQAFIQGQISLQGLAYFFALTIAGLSFANFALKLESISFSITKSKKIFSSQSAWFLSMTFMTAGILIALVAQNYQNKIAIFHFIIAGIFVLILLINFFSKIVFTKKIFKEVLKLFSINLLVLIAFIQAEKSAIYWDFSATHNFTLSQHAKNVIGQLSQRLELSYFLRGDQNTDDQALNFLNLFVNEAKNQNKQIDLKIIDPTQSANLSNQYQLSTSDLVLLNYQNKFIKLKELNLDNLISSLIYLSQKPQKIYLLETGGAAHLNDSGQLGISKFATALVNEGLQIAAIPNESSQIPADASALILVASKQELNQNLQKNLAEYLRNGGKLLLTIDPLYVNYLHDFLQEFGINCQDNIVIDRDQMVFSQGKAGLQPLVRNLADHPITNRLGSTKAVLMNLAASCQAQNPNIADEILWASNGSLKTDRVLEVLEGKLSLEAIFQQYANQQIQPIPLAIASKHADQSPAMVVVGDSDWILNPAFDFYANRDLALNSMQWLLGNNWALVARNQNVFNSSIALSAADFSNLIIWTIILAELFILLGVFRLLWRSRQ